MNQSEREGRTLESWKEIAAYLQRDAKTARNWEKEEGLPVHRHSHKSRSSVYAYPNEIDAWRASRRVVAEPPAAPVWKLPAFALTILLCLIMVGNGVRPVSAQAVAASTRQLWLIGDEDPCCTAPSADGRYIAFTDWSTGDLGVRDLVSGTSRRLTNSRRQRASRDFAEPQKAMSPNGRMIAYVWTTEEGVELRVIPTVGGTPRTLYQGDEYLLPQAWTPDGKQLLVNRKLADNSWQIAMISVADGKVHAIKSLGWTDASPRLSPDGRFIVYARRTEGKNPNVDISLLAVDGSSETALVQNSGNNSSPVWSADSSEVLFVSDRTGTRALWAAPVRDGKPNGLPFLVRTDFVDKDPLGMTRTGSFYYMSRGTGGTNVYVADVDAQLRATQPPRVATDRFLNSNLGPGISQDGERLAYFSDRPGQRRVLMIRNLKTGEEREMGPGGNPNNSRYGPMWFSGSESVLMFGREPNRPGYTFWRVHVSDGKREELLHLAQLGAYSLAPNGKTLFYAVQETDQSTPALFRLDIETKRQTVLGQPGTLVSSISVSPDSQQVAYLVTGVGPKKDGSRLEVMPAAGGQAREVYSDSPWQDPSRINGLGWTADGRSLLFVRGGPSQNDFSAIWSVPASGGRPEPTGISRKGQIKSPQMHPDGKQIYFGASEPAAVELWALENFLPKAPAGK